MKKCKYICDKKECENDSVISEIATISVQIDLEYIEFDLCKKCLEEFKKYFKNINASFDSTSCVI